MFFKILATVSRQSITIMFKKLIRTTINTARQQQHQLRGNVTKITAFSPSFRCMTTDTADSSPKRPTVSEVQLLPRHVSEYSAELLISAALHGDDDAIRERLVREVMRVDSVEWPDATSRVSEIRDCNQSGLAAVKFPYYIGIGIGFVSAWGCLPLVFDLGTAEAFNTAYVTTEHPQPEDVETWLEVGAWTWNWMEPLLGTISFQLLALQCKCWSVG